MNKLLKTFDEAMHNLQLLEVVELFTNLSTERQLSQSFLGINHKFAFMDNVFRQ